MILIFKWVIFTFLIFFAEHILTFKGLNFNFSFLLIYIFVIKYFFPKTEQKKIAPSEALPVLFSSGIGLIEDLFQGIIGPAIISKTITGSLLIILVKQLFFHWTEIFKAFIILIFTVIDETIYSLIMVYFFNFNTEYIMLLKNFFIKGLINIPLALILTWRKP
uniref:Rod shape-determining protein MreD n=1 Tax=Thermodesulfovibrio aggregans TaxID=86166 RepID=A0A7C4EKQ7_9BACT